MYDAKHTSRPRPSTRKQARPGRLFSRTSRTPRTAPAATATPGNPWKRGSLNLVLLVLVALTLSLTVNFVHQIIKSAQLERERAALDAEVAQLEAERARLEGAVAYVESDVYVERVAREQLGYAYEGDTVLVPRYVEQSPEPEAEPPQPHALPTVEPNWRLWWHALFPPE